MRPARPVLVVLGDVLVAARPGGIDSAEALAVGEDGRVVMVGSRAEVLAAAVGATLLDARGAAVLPGLHDFHLHLVGMARARAELRLDDVADPQALVARVGEAAARLPDAEWLRGRGWRERHLDATSAATLNAAVGRRPVLLYSHDAHSAWASPAALEAAGLGTGTADPPGGRIERDADGQLSGILRERATEIVEAVAGRLRGERLRVELAAVAGELLGLGVTSVVDAGDTGAQGGSGPYAALGDRASALLAEAAAVDGRLRVAVGIPAQALAAAAELGVRSGAPLPAAGTLSWGWAKAYLDGALGSRTAALFEPSSCGPRDLGILRLGPEELDAILEAARRARVGIAMHAIGDRAVAGALDALARAARPPAGVPADRIEHVQLLRAADAPRFAALGVTASIQPAHCAADRDLVAECWAGREERAYPWRRLLDAGARLAAGSDAPIETPNPWLALFAAVHRRFPGDGTADWHPEQALTPAEALASLTLDAARAAGRPDLGHLRPGALADFCVLNVDLDALLRADERLAGVRASATFLAGRQVFAA